MEVYKVKDYAEMPKYATEGSACFDIKAAFQAGDRLKSYNAWNKEVPLIVKNVGGVVRVSIPPESRAFIPTGLIFDVPDKHVLEMFIRSSVATKKGLVLANGVGVIDSDYVEESFIALHNISDSLVMIEAGERLAQCRLEKVLNTKLVEVDTPPSQKTSRNGGFGSTGT
jgi:dUTP pyrophosphatase